MNISPATAMLAAVVACIGLSPAAAPPHETSPHRPRLKLVQTIDLNVNLSNTMLWTASPDKKYMLYGEYSNGKVDSIDVCIHPVSGGRPRLKVVRIVGYVSHLC